MSINKNLALARPEIRALQPYQHADWAPQLERMHANEMPWRAGGDSSCPGLNRYPEPQPKALIAHLANLYGVAAEQVLAGRGSDEGIDLLVRAFCRAGQDSILICPPTFGMYKVSACIQGAGVIEAPLRRERNFMLETAAVLAAWRESVKLVFVCSPNNPTGNAVDRRSIEILCERLDGKSLVVVDEAYVEFARATPITAADGMVTSPHAASVTTLLERHTNLVVLRTLSKAYALAGARCGALLAHPAIIALLARVITPYALPTQTVDTVLSYTDGRHRDEAAQRIDVVLSERARLSEQLARLPQIRKVWPSEANFLLVDCEDAAAVLDIAAGAGLIIRDTRSQPGLDGSLRISVGTPQQNDRLLRALARAGGIDTRLFERSAEPAARRARVQRTTRETDITIEVDLDREGATEINTGLGFFDHMLEQIARHGGFSMQLRCKGDLHIDEHHTIEDCALALGQALKTALGDKRGIHRYGFVLPMDEALAQVAIDLSGRPYCVFEGHFGRDQVGQLPTELVPHFFRSLSEALGAAINIKVEGDNTHHMIEACFKGLGRTLRQAIRITDTQLPSTKGML
ncbi:histidinol-phosphate aminotransferase [Steroidobacter denitrificans]|uniref:Multifunctional fusion protein n=1 Tax=Steroidobacter denitrificans TaxID=465721 RepID=A0A127FBI9_STEDE|nr:histidinol-phosphate transaminase [Steroidobacter denitrificans]AMN46970.1 histidinol-phosphate aminotransferase [Steroidobacter denitrificans]